MNQRVTGRYLYHDASGKLAYWKERIEPGRKTAKEFRFYHGDKISGRGGEPILYNLPAVILARAVIFTEGEKQADIVNKWGLCGTTFDSGSNSKFPAAMIPHLQGKRVAVLRDNDAPGMVYAEMIGQTLHGVCEGTRIVLLPGLPPKGDICDWNGNRDELLTLIRAEPYYVFQPLPEKTKAVRNNAMATKGDIDNDMILLARSIPIDSLIDFEHGSAKCLWHEDAEPSLKFRTSTNRIKCFACGASEDAVGLVMKRDGVSFVESVRYLCGK